MLISQIEIRKHKKNRSRRLQKKLRLGKFQEFGIKLKTEFDYNKIELLVPDITQLEEQYWEPLFDRFIDEIIAPNNWLMGGNLSECFIVGEYGKSLTSDDARIIQLWFQAIPECWSAHTTIVDAWSDF